MPRIVVTGVTGQQSGAIARHLAAAGHRVLGVSRGPRPEALDPIIEHAAADAEDPGAFERAFEGADAVVFTVPSDYRPGARERLSQRVAAAAASAGAGRVVANLSIAIPALAHAKAPGAGRAVAANLLSGTVPAFVLSTTIFMDNLLWAAPDVPRTGVFGYPLPEDARVSWLSHRHLAGFVEGALAVPADGRRVFHLGGPEALTGPEVADRLAAKLGRPVRYEPLPSAAYAAQLNAAMGEPVGTDVAELLALAEADRGVFAREPGDWAPLAAAPDRFADWIARQDWLV